MSLISISMRTVFLAALAWAMSARAETTLAETRSTLEKWVETRQLISRTRSDWQSDKEMLEQNIQLFERELKSVEEQMRKVDTNNVQVEKERAQAEAGLKSSNASLESARQFAAGFESQIGRLVPQLPAPLQDLLKPSLARMPTNAASTRMPATERLQVIVGVLNELDKFNNSVSIFGEKRKNQKGEEVAVETVYVGLGTAYFVNDAGDFAGAGAPGPDGWEWSIKPELAASVREVIHIYRNERPARFVPLPANIR
jgi:septal ring factor EnvC (AmiA/AmiB activator)